MIEVFFIARHTPFWAVPLMILSAEFGYMFWLRKKKRSLGLCIFIFIIATSALSFYIWAGGPERSVKVIKKLHREMD